jgi:prepilin-type N-terminal cleavage/methylation domain-containing protein
MKNIKSKTRAFTIIEMLVTLSIITLLTTMVLVYSRQSEKVTNLIRDSDKMVYELRRAQNLAMLTLHPTTTVGGSSSDNICGWGIYIDKENLPQTQYILFNDFCNTGTRGQYDSGEAVETINLLKGVAITDSNIKSIIFVPPEPQVKFDPSSITEASITMCLENNPNCFTIHITSAGQIYKE